MKINNIKIKTDTQGYLINPLEWNEKIAYQIAKQENIHLNIIHWKIIYFIRSFYLKYNTSPTMRMLIKAMEQDHKKKWNSRYLFYLFPKGPAKQATKIAGIPKPVKCL